MGDCGSTARQPAHRHAASLTPPPNQVQLEGRCCQHHAPADSYWPSPWAAAQLPLEPVGVLPAGLEQQGRQSGGRQQAPAEASAAKQALRHGVPPK